MDALFGVVVDMSGNTIEDKGAGAELAVNGLFGAVADIGGNAELDGTSFFVEALPKLNPVVVGASLFVVLPNPDTELGACFDIDEKNDETGFGSVFAANVVEAKGFFGAAFDIGGNALDEEVAFSSFFGTGVDDVVAKGLLGAAFDIGGNADEDAVEGTGVFAVDEVNGLFGAAFDMGGNAEEDAGAGVFANGFFGAAADIGGNAEEGTGAAALVAEVKGLFGAALDIGGKAALAGEGAFSSFFGAAKLKPAGVVDDDAADVVDDPTPNEKPPGAGAVAVESSFFGAAAKLKPVTPDVAGAGAGALPPNENPPAPILLLLVAAGAPNENPPAPILPAAGAEVDEVAPAALTSEPGFGVSQAGHTESEGLFVTIQTPHFHEPSSDFLNIPPHPSAAPPVLSFDAASELSATSAPAVLSSSDSSSLSPSPNSHSMYQSMKALRVITLSLDASSTLLIFLMVRRCSSSQYVEPNDSNSLGNSVTEICSDSFARASNASSAFSFSSAISLSCDEPSSSSS
mmetsp:Transcript_20164/g.29950  ORF Transcript_20164/g.29950 Transcript_20164/m.29950 type:complete len:516 (+) Transcript_20164:4340-5887(+)